MNNPIMSILTKYCESQGIELKNMASVATEIEDELDRLIPIIVHELGILVEEDVEKE